MRHGKAHNFLLLLLLTVMAAMPAPCFAAAGEPIDQLRESVDRILAILRRQDPDEQWVQKKEEIVAIVKSRFDADELAQRVLAQHWRARSESEKKEFVSLFSQVLETTYINKLKAYSDEQVLFTRQIIKEDRGMVYSQIVRNNQEIPIHYRVKNNNGDWRIYDIIIEGVSLVQNYRTQFDQILKQEDYAGLVRRMEEKIRENQAKDLEE
jgi:phospholipid transport system substrate-binding protein